MLKHELKKICFSTAFQRFRSGNENRPQGSLSECNKHLAGGVVPSLKGDSCLCDIQKADFHNCMP